MTLMNALWSFPFLQDFLIWQLQWCDEEVICKSDLEVFDQETGEYNVSSYSLRDITEN